MELVLNRHGQLVRYQAPRQRKPALSRFLARVIVSDEHSHEGTPCWFLAGAVNENGYAQIRDDHDRVVGAHVFAYEQYIDDVPPGYEVRHRCQRRACVAPRHLEAVRRDENLSRRKDAQRLD